MLPSAPDTAARSGPPPPGGARIKSLVTAALTEDIGAGDVTTEAVIPSALRARGRFLAKEALVVCGLPFAREVFAQLDPEAAWSETAREGEAVAAGAVLAQVEGRGRAVLSGERTALNFVQRLSGIATLARRAVEEISGTQAAILDTRKTTPTLRDIEKYAVRIGGGTNHRMGLYDAVLVKDNHLALAGGIREAVRRAGAAGFAPSAIEVEVEDIQGALEAIHCGVGRILLDNFALAEVAQAVKEIAGRARVEVSGGLDPGCLLPFASAGVDYLSIGRLTHSARAVDISLEVERVDP